MQGSDLYRFRKAKKITQKELSELFGCKQPFISDMESMRRPIPRNYIALLKEKYGDEVDQYISNEINEPGAAYGCQQCKLRIEENHMLRDEIKRLREHNDRLNVYIKHIEQGCAKKET